MNQNTFFITVLSDGETFTDIQGTSIMVLSEDQYLDANEGIVGQCLAKYDLTNPVHLRMLADRIETLR
jgi:hypothetical protein